MSKQEKITFYQKRLDEVNSLISDVEPHIRNHSAFALRRMAKIKQGSRARGSALMQLALISERESLLATINFYKDRVDRANVIKTESGPADKLGSDGAVAVRSEEENLTDIMGTAADHQIAGKSVGSAQGQNNMLEMSDFLARPVEIWSSAIPLDTDASYRFKVWDEFTLVPSVRAKLRNYAYLRGDLHVRVAVSGTPFDYGRLLISYQPWAAFNAPLTALIDMGATGRKGLLAYMSQSDGAFTINVNENQPTELVCPFISPKPMHRLFNTATTAISAVTSFQDLIDCGDLLIYTLNQVNCTSALPSEVTLQVYAWMENVQLGTSTGTQLAIATESGVDERVVGPVERIASSVVKISSVVADIPILAPFALASGMIAGVIGKIASLFGWSKPVMNDGVSLVKNKPFANGALTIGYDTNSRIVLDPKQELAIDANMVGVSEDGLVICHMAARRSYVRTFIWSPDDTLMLPIYSSRVTPSLVTNWVNTKNYVVPTAMAFAVAPFSFWRGDIVFRLEVVCSAFHRGKFLVMFEPNLSQFGIITTTISLNKQFIKIVDIQQTQIVDFRVNWASYRSWLKVSSPEDAILNADPAQTGNATGREGYANGFICVVPFTQLQTPDSQPVEVNVYAWCDNLQVNGLCRNNLPTSREIYTESGIVTESGVSGVSSSVEVTMVDLNLSDASTDTICLEHFGEQPISFRALLKRYVSIAALSYEPSTNPVFEISGRIIPYNGMLLGTANFSYYDILSYLRQAYLGIRGSIRYRFHVGAAHSLSTYAQARVTLGDPSDADTPYAVAKLDTPTIALLSGTDTFVPHTNGGIEVDFPCYTNNLFLISFSDDDNLTTNANGIMEDTYYRNFLIQLEAPGTAAMDTTPVVVDYATGEDFNLLRFQGAVPYSFV